MLSVTDCPFARVWASEDCNLNIFALAALDTPLVPAFSISE